MKISRIDRLIQRLSMLCSWDQNTHVSVKNSSDWFHHLFIHMTNGLTLAEWMYMGKRPLPSLQHTWHEVGSNEWNPTQGEQTDNMGEKGMVVGGSSAEHKVNRGCVCAHVCDFIAPPIELSLWAKNTAMGDMRALPECHAWTCFTHKWWQCLFVFSLRIKPVQCV